MQAFQQVQHDFIQHIKDGQNNNGVDGIEDRRLAIYRDLFFNNVNGFVSSGFPVLRSLYNDEDWTVLVRDFFIKHDCHSPYFIDIAKEFIDYLVNERQAQDNDLPFMAELAHYEWVELDVSVRKELHHYKAIAPNSIHQTPMVLSETAWPLSYAFAVHQISTDYLPEQGQPGSVFLIVYRDWDDDVQFMQINAVTAVLMQLLGDNPGVMLDDLIAGLTEQLAQFEPQQIKDGATQMVENLVGKGIIRYFVES